MSGPENSRTNHALFRLVGVASGLAFGGMVASLFAVKSTPGGLVFELNAGAVISFVVCAVIAWFYWRVVERMAMGAAPQQRRRRFKLFSAGLLLVGVISFLYPLKFIPEEKRKDVFIGLALAIGVLSGVGYVMCHVKKFLEADEKRTEDEDRRAGE